jgi:formylglycine-generating enzyme required for sulfatase activity
MLALLLTGAGSGCATTLSPLEAQVKSADFEAVCLAVEDLRQSFGAAYPVSAEEQAELQRARAEAPALLDAALKGDVQAGARLNGWVALSRKALLANPLLDFDTLLVIKRSEKQLGLPQNWESNSTLPMSGFDNELDALSPIADGTMTTLYRPENSVFVGDVDLHFDADRLLFSMPGDNGRWQLHEMTLADKSVRQLPLITEADVDNYDACYLPDGNILFTSTAPFTGVPCVTGSSHVSNLYRCETATGAIRQLTFEQDHDWCPTLLNSGRVMYLRWEYSDIPHYVSRILFHMNPDGTSQMEYYGSNSYWPNAMFYARPVPNHPTMFCAIVGGHHDVPRMGELVLFDPARGRVEADGVVQRIPGRGKKVEPIIRDGLVGASWPKFLHPYPLSDKYFIVSAKPTAESRWGVYLVDVFDNMTLLKELDGYALLEPVPLRATQKPPVVPDKVDLARDDATVYMSDVYTGPGLKDVPRGTVRQMRLFTYHFAYHGVGGQINRVGLDGPWDIKRVLGTVPVEPDGSAYFRVPANTPISVQPLDDKGQALQLMRSWMTAMPGETLSCAGCHEKQNTPPPAKAALASRRAPSEITPWYGPERGFSFRREVQPVLDRHCTGCHDGSKPELPDFRDLPDVHTKANDAGYNDGSHFPPSYLALRRYIHGATMESDIHLLTPMDFHASTMELIQRLRVGHHGVTLEPEAWDRLITWIDLNTPAHGTWHEIVGAEKVAKPRERRMAMAAKYAPNRAIDPEAILDLTPFAGLPPVTQPDPSPKSQAIADAPEKSPFEGGGPEGRGMLSPSPPDGTRQAVDLGGGVTLELASLPAGAFRMGANDGYPDEAPATDTAITEPFWMGVTEVTNEQYARFDPAHDSRIENGDFLQFSVEERGYPLNGPKQPVARVSWNEAMAFCAWLSEKTGGQFTLPDEAQWEYACRAGTVTPMWYGGVDADFAGTANLADHNLFRVDTFDPWKLPSGAIHPWRPAIDSVDDGHRVSAPAGGYAANPWGLFDTHGNVAEWTRSIYRPYPWRADDGHNNPAGEEDRVARGGSWYDRPERARSAFRQHYAPWQRVYNVGFRVMCAHDPVYAR